MKRQAILTLIKDIVIAVVAFFLITWVLSAGDVNIFGNYTGMNAAFIGLAVAGIPFGFRWAGKLFTAVSGKGFLIKLVIAVALGWIAVFVVIIGDIIRCFTAPKTPTE